MEVIDYNGSGCWSRESILQRYEEYADRLNLASLLDLRPMEHEGEGKRWIYPVMGKVIDGIEKGDPACTQIGVEFIEEDASFAFGQILKASTARALRRTALTSEQMERIRRRVVDMIVRGYLPREFKQYQKLARKIGLGPYIGEIAERADFSNPWVCRYYEQLRDAESKRGIT